MDDKQSVQVTIFHQTYTLRASENEREVQELADTVDQLMNAVAEKSPNADSVRIAVLACFHLADRLRALERELEDLRRKVDRKSQQYRMLLDKAIGGGGTTSA